ncbi:hypothetical protein [Sphaerisporangium dianthi]|uniref:Uncharacterized protein n=1 Tax=Sphaerisporangium dianthi TaxID=1436120 RepID=A0ABV9CT60_9ACTN
MDHRDYAGRYRALLQDHDLLFVDPRGAGRPTPLTCRGVGRHAGLARGGGRRRVRP